VPLLHSPHRQVRFIAFVHFLDDVVWQAGDVHDYEVQESDTVFTGRVISLRRDVVAMPGETTSQRDVVVHPGAVGVVALRGDQVLLVNQYRHPVGRRLDELPAGLLDVEGEPGLLCAQRELKEEAGLAAATWHVLVDVLTSPGMTDESIRLFLAQDVHEVERDVQEHEELEMTSRWVPLSAAVDAALDGSLENAACVIGVLAAAAAMGRGFGDLRPADAPWRARPTH
jgi:ADP-ribose pyrophosphatase